jgi:hypothetical protein
MEEAPSILLGELQLMAASAGGKEASDTGQEVRASSCTNQELSTIK